MSIEIQYIPALNTSNSFDFHLTRNQIIELAYENLGVKGSNQTLTAEQYSRGSNMLNAMVKNWASEDVFLWQICWTNLPLSPSDIANVDGVDYECLRNNTSSLRNKPGSGEDWPSFWKVLSTNTGTTWSQNTNYTNIANYFLDTNIICIDTARIKQGEGFTPLTPMTKDEYFSLGNPLISGKPTRYFYRRQELPEIFLYPAPDNATDYTIEICVYKYPEDFDVGTDDADFLQEWLEPLIFGLAVRLAPQHGIFGSQLNDLKKMEMDAKEIARSSDHEFGDVFIKPDLSERSFING